MTRHWTYVVTSVFITLCNILTSNSVSHLQYTSHPVQEPRCWWLEPTKLECHLNALAPKLSAWIIQEHWPIAATNEAQASFTSGLSSSSMMSSVSFVTSQHQQSTNSFRDARQVTSLTIICQHLPQDSSLSSDTFLGLDELTTLAIFNCRLNSIPAEAMVNFRQLKDLKVISKNEQWTSSLSLQVHLNSLPSSLEILDLSSNSIWQFPSQLFCSFDNLLSLNLSNNKIQNIGDLKLGFISLNDKSTVELITRDDEEEGFESTKQVTRQVKKPKDILEYEIDSVGDFNYAGTTTTNESNAPQNLKPCGRSLQSIILSNNALVRLFSKSFDGLVEVKSIYLSNNDIRIVSKDAFKGLESLEILDLSSNSIMSLSNKTFDECLRMEKLYLRNNSLTGFSPETFRAMNGLQILDLSHNQLHLNEGNENMFSGLRRLVILNLSNNKISNILPQLFQDLTGLQILDLSYNELTSIDEQVFSTMFNLYELKLSDNKIHHLSSFSFSGLVGLNLLNLNNNSLTNIHIALLQPCSNVRHLILSNNDFDSVPSAIQNLSFLNHLDLSGNQILKTDSYNFDQLSNLMSLNVSSNFLTNITKNSFQGLQTISLLDLSDNNIANIMEASLDSIKGLKNLNLSRNKLVNINGLFAGMESLESLDLSENLIMMFDYAFLPRQLLRLILNNNEIKQLGNFFKIHNVLALEVIDASENKISVLSEVSLPNTIKRVSLVKNAIHDIKPGTFREKIQIEYINIRMNQMSKLNPKSVSPKWITKNQKEATLLLGGNPLICDCEMEWLYRTSVNSLNKSSEHRETNHRLPKIGDVSDVVCTLPHKIGNITTYAKITNTSPENYLCPYATHCFALCHCCDYIACDCRMQCPTNCSCFHDDAWSMNLVDCSRGNMDRLPDKVPMDATVVFLDGNNFKILHAHHFIGRHSIQKLYLNSSNVQILHNRTFHGLSSLKYLFLQDNRIVKLSGIEFSGLGHLKELHLQNNRISYLNNNTFEDLNALEVLRIDNNFIIDFPVWLLSNNLNLNKVHISNNPWNCGCEFTVDFGIWFNANRNITDSHENIFCIMPDTGTMFSEITEPDFACKQGSSRIMHHKFGQHELPFLAGGLCGGLILITVLIAASIFYIRRKASTAQKLGYSSSSSFSHEEDGRVFDAYIIYSVEEANYVRDALGSKLEHGSPSYKLCLHARDFNGTSRLPEFISQSICFSRKIILVLSNSFINCEWTNTLFRRATLECLKRRENHLIVVNFDGTPETSLDAEFRTLLKNASKIRWGDKHFWKKLYELLPPKSVYSGLSLYISDPLYKSPVPLLSPPRGMELPSSSSVLTNTTGLTTPSDPGRCSLLQESITTYKAPPPPRPCQQSSCDYMYMGKSSCHCHGIATPCYSSVEADSASVHTYNSLEILAYQRQSSPESHHYSIINTSVSPKRQTVRRACRSSQNSPGPYDNIPVAEATSYRQSYYKGTFKSSEEEEELNEIGEEGSVSSTSTQGGTMEDNSNEDYESNQENNLRNMAGLSMDECFV